MLNLTLATTIYAQTYITTIAGTGAKGNAPDNVPALNAALQLPEAIAVDESDNIYIADTYNNCIRRIDAITGIMSIVVKGLFLPSGIAFDGKGNMYISDRGDHVIYRYNLISKILTIIAGKKGQSVSFHWLEGGDNGPATSAKLGEPTGLVLDAVGNIYVCQSSESRIRKIDAVTGIITTVAGGGSGVPNGIQAINASVIFPKAILFDKEGNYYFSALAESRVCKVDINTGIITTVAGRGINSGHNGDGGPAVDAGIPRPYGIAMDKTGNLYIADFQENVIRKVDAVTGIITRIAGTGVSGYSGDTGLALQAKLSHPYGIAVDSKGVLYIADRDNNVVRKLIACNPNKIDGPSAACINSSVSLVNSQPGGTWSISDNAIASIDQNGTIIGKKSGTTTVTYTVASIACGNSISQMDIRIAPLPIVNFDLPKICLPDGNGTFIDRSFIINGTENGFSYKWFFYDRQNPSAVTEKNPSHRFSAIGPFNIKLVITSNEGCTDSLVRQLTSIYSQPKAGFWTSDNEICINDAVSFTDTSAKTGGSPVTWEWSVDGTVVSRTQSMTRAFSDSVNYNVGLSYVDANGCRSDTSTVIITSYAYPVLNLDSVLILYEGDTTTLNPSYYGTGLDFLWLPATYLNNNRIARPLTSTRNDISYTLQLTNKAGCMVAKSINIKVLKELIVPNAFTPNGDGINDTWSLRGLNTYPGATVQVFNRDGNVVFSSKGYTAEWSGTYRDKVLPVGTYYYIINPGNNRAMLSGSVTIIR